MQDKEARKILEDKFFRVAAQVGMLHTAHRYTKKKLGLDRRTVPTEGNLYQKARQVLTSSGSVLTDEPDQRLVLYVMSGFAGRNPAVVELAFPNAEVTVTAWAKEGWIDQKTAAKAADTALRSLGLA